MSTETTSYTDRVLSRTEQVGECVVWTGARTKSGYGVANWGGQYRYLHRLVFSEAHGEPAGDVDHICGNRSCVRIEHLRELSRQQNTTHRTVMSHNNRSGYPGVGWSEQKQRWRVRVKADGREKHVGFANTKREAYEMWRDWQELNNPVVHEPFLRMDAPA